ncbi:MAG: DEAD/DEAH box helicase family protein [Chloroflexi bacterium]|nr:DEAD/DEAH box helicase family protein [Chloroflexota bacterium]
MWSHQADVLRSWHTSFQHSQDVAFELPTGTGKTLIALLIGEYRRQAYGERIAYLCPTRQLAYQVNSLSSVTYGIPTNVLVGPQADYDPKHYSAYASGEAIAVTTYSAIFNNNPRINDANVLIFDDAHAADQYVSSPWTVNINRFEDKDLYFGFLELFRDKLPSWLLYNLRKNDDPMTRGTVDKLPSPVFFSRREPVTDYFDSKLPSKLSYAWQNIRGHLAACNVYLTWPLISIRPLVPPTLTLQAVAGAKQRLFISATLGANGDLEGFTGIKGINRIPAPLGWDKQGSGRRFILFPEMTLPPKAAERAVLNVMRESSRTLVLTPDGVSAEKMHETIARSLPQHKLLTASSIEESLEPFTSETEAILLLQGRYDGLDLPGTACNLEIINGLPSATSPQEKFLFSRLGAHSVLRDRIQTRVTQGLGRCTRGATDHAVILVYGDHCLDNCIKAEFISGLHPELQAEFEYAREASKVGFPEDLEKIAKAFMTKEPGWEQADGWIRELRDKLTRQSDPTAAVLLNTVAKELDYGYAIWNESYEVALQKARECCDHLEGVKLAPYRAWWYYLAGNAAFLAERQTGKTQYGDVARELFGRASAAAPAIAWFRTLGQDRQIATGAESELTAEQIEKRLGEVGIIGSAFEEQMSDMLRLIDSNVPQSFHQGLELLGCWLGFGARRAQSAGEPDGVWWLGDTMILAFEAKTQESAEGPISLSWCRETQGHLAWVKTNLGPPASCPLNGVIISSRQRVSFDSRPVRENLYAIDPAAMRKLAREVCDAIRGLRAAATDRPSEEMREIISQRLAQLGLDPGSILRLISSVPIGTLSEVK